MSETLISSDRIQHRVRELAAAIDHEAGDSNPLLICVLKGAYHFASDLHRALTIDAEIDFIQLSSYGRATKSSGDVLLKRDLSTSISSRLIYVVEDIVDTGHTFERLLQHLEDRGPESIRTCSLLSKPARREIEVPIHHLGFEIEDRFVVGYGLDYAERYRGLSHIAVLDESSS